MLCCIRKDSHKLHGIAKCRMQQKKSVLLIKVLFVRIMTNKTMILHLVVVSYVANTATTIEFNVSFLLALFQKALENIHNVQYIGLYITLAATEIYFLYIQGKFKTICRA